MCCCAHCTDVETSAVTEKHLMFGVICNKVSEDLSILSVLLRCALAHVLPNLCSVSMTVQFACSTQLLGKRFLVSQDVVSVLFIDQNAIAERWQNQLLHVDHVYKAADFTEIDFAQSLWAHEPLLLQ